MRRWPQSPELREEGEIGFLGNPVSVPGFLSNLVNTRPAPKASAAVPLLCSVDPLPSAQDPPTQSCFSPNPNSVPAPSYIIRRVRPADKLQGGGMLRTNQSRRPYLQHYLSGMNVFSTPPPHVFLNLFFWLWFRASSWTAHPRIHAGTYCPPPTACSAPGGVGGELGSLGSLKGGGGSWGSWGCNKPGTPSLASSQPASSSRTARGREIGGR